MALEEVSNKNRQRRYAWITPYCFRSLRGQQPAQETRCFDDGNTDMSEPISERMEMAVIGFLFFDMIVPYLQQVS